jgi:hypothetical protein
VADQDDVRRLATALPGAAGGDAAVLVRLPVVPLDMLERLLRDAWQLRQRPVRRRNATVRKRADQP